MHTVLCSRFIGVEYRNSEIHSIVMENISGVLLEKYIIEQHHLKETTIKQYLAQLVDAVAFIHSKLYIHM
jgi:serine/threonine protein kinase